MMDLGPAVAPMLLAVVGVEILRGGDRLPLLPTLEEVSIVISNDILPAGGLTQDIYKKKLKEIHTNDVRTEISNNIYNPVLNEPAPPIHKDELKLPRKTRSTLAQLRSGYSSYLNSYLSRISSDNAIQNICQNCNQSPHDTYHLFSCPAKPTRLTARSLWERPIESAEFLDLPGVSDDGG